MISKFKLGAVEWNVKVDNDRMDDLGLMGLCEFPKSLISMCDKFESKDAIEQTLYHEVVHAILTTMGYSELNNNEEFVQQFSVLLHQFEKTKE